jgi:AraC family transcriptional regulator of adaptative response/methylated-DNA-[protein]-cysteine methyltransferase
MYRTATTNIPETLTNPEQILSMTPAGSNNSRIRFALGEGSLGWILVAISEKGICAISLGDDPEALARDLHDRFPQAELIGDDREFEQWLAQVIAFVEAPAAGLDIRGTAFQQRVWQALREIPAGQTISYAGIAQRIGVPDSIRAVASACAANSLAVAIPCHRVIRSDGTLSGYRWGVKRKAELQRREALSV